jgi:transposase
LGVIPNTAESVSKLIKKLGKPGQLRVCYEAGPTGYVLYWQLTKLGVHCEVVAPTLIPVKPGDRVKTDRRDAEKLARCYRAGDLTAVWVPDAAHEALRDLVRAREAAKADQLRARNRLSKFLLRQGRRDDEGTTPWTGKYMKWIKEAVHFEQPAQEATLLDYLHEVEHAAERIERLEKSIDVAIETVPQKMRAVIQALQSLRGIAKVSAVSIVAELGEISRFDKPRQLMGYSGAVSSEDSSAQRTRRGAITKAGNAHLRRIVVEAAWSYRYRPSIGAGLAARQKDISEEIKEIAWKAQHRLHSRYSKLLAKGKTKQKVVTAVGRELLGFIWAIGVHVEQTMNERVPTRRAA